MLRGLDLLARLRFLRGFGHVKAAERMRAEKPALRAAFENP